MELRDRAVALYGRFSPGARDRLERGIVRTGGIVARDLTRRSDVLVIGALASVLVESGALTTRLTAARSRGVPVFGEHAFASVLSGEGGAELATLPLSTALSGTELTRNDAEVLAAFDLVHIAGDHCRFADAAVLHGAAELLGAGQTLADVVRTLTRVRDGAPRGRHKIVLTGSGAALQWPDGLTSLEGQGLLPLDEANATLDDLFEAAALAEADGQLEEAARLYDLCYRADRTDAIASYNLGNIRLSLAAYDLAILAYQRALARDRNFVEARYNLAQAFEAAGKTDAAILELARIVEAEPDHSDAVFNLAQLKMKHGELAAARALYERYLAMAPPADWAQTARKAMKYCEAHLAV